MFQNAFIDIAIGLVLMYLVLSLVCTVINEFISTTFSLRANTLKTGLANLIDVQSVRDAFYNHGLIKGQTDATGADHLSYISAATFVPALLDSLDPTKQTTAADPTKQTTAVDPTNQTSAVDPANQTPAVDPTKQTTAVDPTKQTTAVEKIRTAIENIRPEDSTIRTALLAQLNLANDNLDVFRKNVSTWFDDAMDRITGAYKRWLKWISLAIGIALAVIVNADTVRVGKALWSDSSLRTAVVNVADNYIKQCGDKCAVPSDGNVNWNQVRDQYQSLQTNLRPLPIGWPEKIEGSWIGWFIQKVGGLLVTGLALSLGAPFWFDMLTKFMNIRGAGTKPKREDEKDS